MKYCEKYLFGHRLFEINDDQITALESGFMSPYFKENFYLKDLSPNWSEMKAVNRINAMPTLFLSLFMVILFLCCVSLHKSMPEPISMGILLVTPITLVASLFVFLNRNMVYIFKYNSGVPAFGIGRGRNTNGELDDILKEIKNKIMSAQQLDTSENMA